MTTFAGQNMTLTIDGQEFSGMITSVEMSCSSDVYTVSVCGDSMASYVPRVTHTTGTMTFDVGNISTAEDMFLRDCDDTALKRTPEDENWLTVRDYVEKGFDGHIQMPDGQMYEIKKVDRDSIDDLEVNMKKVYALYVANREDGQVVMLDIFSGDADYDTALRTAILGYSHAIKSIGDPDVVKVWLKQVGDFEEIEE